MKNLNRFKMKNLAVPTNSNMINGGSIPRNFSFSMKNYSSEKDRDIHDFTEYDYNKFNAPNISLDEKTKKDIEETFSKIQKNYEKNPYKFQPDPNENIKVQVSEQEQHNFKPVLKYSSCDYIPRVYYESATNEDDDKTKNNGK